MRKSPKITITIPSDLYDQVKIFADTTDRKISNAIAHLVRIGIKTHDMEQSILRDQAAPYITAKKDAV